MIAAVGLVALIVQIAPTGEATASEASASFAGRSLEGALQSLRAGGLKIIYTSNVVRAHMRVTAEPTADGLRGILDELLEPHGLEALDGPNEAIVVVPRLAAVGRNDAPTGGSSIIGTVRSHRDATPVAGVSLRLVEPQRTATSAGDGSFSIADVAAGAYTLEVRRRGFVVERIDGVRVEAGRPTRLAVLLDPAPISAETLVVTPIPADPSVA